MDNRKSRITLACTSFSGGGAERVMVVLANEFIERGFEVDYVVARDEGPYKELLDTRINKVSLSKKRGIALIDRIHGFFRLVKYFNNSNPDVFMSTLREFNVFCFFAYFLSRSNSRFVVREASTLDVLIYNRNVKSIFIKLLMKFAYKHSSHVIANSDSTKKDLLEYLNLSEDKVSRIYNPLVMPEVVNVTKSNLIVGCGRLVELKNFKDLVIAFSRVKLKRPEAELVILGDGPERFKLEQLIDRLGLTESVSLPGFVNEPYRYFSKAKVFAHTSKWEGFGYVLAEAMACGTSVVAYDSRGAISEVLGEGRYGKLVENGNMNALVESIDKYFDTPLSSSMLSEGASRFRVDKISDSYLKVLLHTE